MFFSPLEQFDLIYIFNFYGFDVSNIVFFFFFISIIMLLIVFFFKGYLFSISFFQYCFEVIYFFIIEIIIQQTGNMGLFFFPFVFFTFFFILLSNLIGMLPFSFTITAHLSITFFLAFAFNLSFILIGFLKNGWSFLNLFKPEGTPSFLLPLIIIIEVVSYLIRTFSLSIRLFANMMAGHCSLYVISSFVFTLLATNILLSIPLIFIYIGIFLLEFAIALIQAYVFTILLCIYLNDSLHPGH